MPTLFWSPQSRAERMFWLLEEVGQPYDLVHVDIRAQARTTDPRFAEASPLGKVPALADGPVRIADSGAIALYLADRYAPALAPAPDAPERGAYLYWMFFSASALEPAITEKFVEMPPNPTSYPWGSFERMYDAVETRLTGRDWFAGDAFTMADAMMAGSVEIFETFRIAPLTDRMRAFVDRCHARPAFARGQEKLAAAKAALG